MAAEALFRCLASRGAIVIRDARKLSYLIHDGFDGGAFAAVVWPEAG